MIPHLSLIFWLAALLFFAAGASSRWWITETRWPHSLISAGLFCCVLAALVEGKLG